MKNRLAGILSVLLLFTAASCKVKEDEPAPGQSFIPENTATPVTEDTAEPESSSDPKENTRTLSLSDFLEKNDAKASGDHFLVYEYPLDFGDRQIYGWLYLPDDGAENWPFTIVCHGFQGNYYGCSPIASRLADSGIAVYVFDFCGGSTYSRSSGDFYSMSLLTERDDLSALLDEFRTYDFLEKDRFFLLGESQGGAVSAITAAERPDDIAGLVLFYPAFNIPDIGRELYGDMDHIPPEPASFGLPVGWRYFGDTINMDIWSSIRGFEKDVLILHGSADTIVPLSYSEKASEVYQNARLEVFPDTEHGFTEEELDEACRMAAEMILDKNEP